MLLQRLAEDAERIVGQLPPAMYDMKPVRWIIDVDAEGGFQGCTRTAGDGGPRDRGKPMLVPFVKRTSGLRPILFADTPAYTLGLGDDVRVQVKHEAYTELVRQCACETGSPAATAVLRFLETESAGVAVPEDLLPSDLVTFRVQGAFPVDEDAIRMFWAMFASSEQDDSSAELEGECLVCGKRAAIPPMMPVPVKGIPGGQSSGTALVGANMDVFESYGLRRAATSPVCHRCGERFGKALNELLRGDSTHLAAGPLVFVVWTKEEVDFDFVGALNKPDADTVRLLLSSYRTGKRVSVRDASVFNAVALSASGGRAVVREWMTTTVDQAKQNLARWFELIGQVDSWGAAGDPLGLYKLAAAPYRDAAKQMAPQLPASLVAAALRGRSLPEWVLAVVVKRCRAGPAVVHGRKQETVSYAQAALMKAVLVSGLPGKEAYMSELDTNERAPAYVCGRLLAVLEAIQQRAIPGINSTVTDKFFASASTAPASVFGKLLSDAQPHLSKLRKSSSTRGAAEALQRRVEEVLALLDDFPTTLALRDQALFSLGYYHQRGADRAARVAAKDARRGPEAQADVEMEESA